MKTSQFHQLLARGVPLNGANLREQARHRDAPQAWHGEQVAADRDRCQGGVQFGVDLGKLSLEVVEGRQATANLGHSGLGAECAAYRLLYAAYNARSLQQN